MTADDRRDVVLQRLNEKLAMKDEIKYGPMVKCFVNDIIDDPIYVQVDSYMSLYTKHIIPKVREELINHTMYISFSVFFGYPEDHGEILMFAQCRPLKPNMYIPKHATRTSHQNWVLGEYSLNDFFEEDPDEKVFVTKLDMDVEYVHPTTSYRASLCEED